MYIEFYAFSLDEETIKVYQDKTQESEPLEEKKSKPVDEDKPKSDVSDKMLILEEGWMCITSIIM